MHASLGSTQDTAAAAGRGGEPGRLAVLAALQTAGRASRGRRWDAPAGNLNLSLLLRPAMADGPPEPGRWALLAGLALHSALCPYAPGVQLKWPNDLLLDGAKLGGILIDGAWGGPAGFVVIGLGANLRAAPMLDGRQAAHLPPPAPAAVEVARAVVAALDAWMEASFADIRAAWLARAHPVGTLLDIHTPQRRLAGAFEGLSTRGELLISGSDAPISSAEIFLRPDHVEAAPCC